MELLVNGAGTFALRKKSVKLQKQRTSYVEENLHKEERKFLRFVRLGDIERIRTLLNRSENLSVDCQDYRGQRALEIAVCSHNSLLVEFLLSEIRVSDLHFYCAILRAVLENEIDILETLLDRAAQDTALEKRLHDLIGGGAANSNILPDVVASSMTPLMVAATKGNVEITHMLVEREFRIQTPEVPKCGESLTESMSRMNAYRALASPTYMIHDSPDPILTAFQLSRKLDKLSHELIENKNEYKQLANQCSAFAAALLNQCRNTEEVQTLLEQSEGFDDPRPHQFSRLLLAVQYEQKEFVTHPHSQQVLRSIWVEGLSSWNSWSCWRRSLHIIQHAFLTPFISIAYIFIPRLMINNSYSKGQERSRSPLSVPLNRCIYFATSYIVFLSLILATLLKEKRRDDTWTGLAVSIWVIAHMWAIVLNLCCLGFSNYFRMWWCVFDLIMFTLFVVAEAILIGVLIYNYKNETSTTWPRSCWPWYHPILLAEGIYALASVMAFTKILFWCNVNSRLGPLGISFKYMIDNVVRFLCLFFIIMFAFAIGINSIYKNYQGSTDGSNESRSGKAFATLKKTFRSLFWAIFGLAEDHYGDITIYGSSNSSQANDVLNQTHHYFTEGVGFGLWGLYHLITVVVLLNMLIAMMAESYQRVVRNVDMEWKFACSTFWLSVLDDPDVVPPPFNLISLVHCSSNIFQWIVQKARGKHTNRSFCFCCNVRPKDPVQEIKKENYEKLLIQLVRRYLQSKDHKEGSNSSPVVSEVMERMNSYFFHDLRKSLTMNNNHSNNWFGKLPTISESEKKNRSTPAVAKKPQKFLKPPVLVAKGIETKSQP